MGDYFVFTAIGTDRVGIVDEIAAVLEAENCNIEESRMAVLGTEFSVMLLASGDQGIVQILEKDLPDIGDKLGLHVQIRPTRAPRGSSEGRPYSIEAISLDAPGIMHAVTAVLKRAGANIEEISTETTSAPWTGATMFQMRGTLIVPREIHIAELRDQLENLEHERDIDIVLKPLNR